MYENDQMSFTAILPDGQIVEKWTVNDNLAPEAYPWIFHYTVATADIKSGAISIDYTVKTAAQATIHFDASKIKCWRNVDDAGLTGTLVADGGTVYEGDSLLLIAQPAAGKMADSWAVNGKHQLEWKGNYSLYRVEATPSEFRFDYTEKIAEKVELRFNASKIRCTKLYDQTPIMPGQRDEGDVLIFRTVDGSAVLWKVNGNNIPGRRSYYMQEEYGNGNVLKISYE